MIGNIDLNTKSYEQILEESISQIPIYSKDWTNYNVSDPGITILENLSAFSALLQSQIDEVPEKIKFKLLELVGFKPKAGRLTTVYIENTSENIGDEIRLVNGVKLYAQDICFEFGDNKVIKNTRITSIRPANLFSQAPKSGCKISLCLEKIPEIGDDMAIYFEMEKQFERNPFEKGELNPFAKVRWEILTQNGNEEIEVEDGTNCFMQSGYVTFKVKREMLSNVIHIIFEKADYDIVPKFLDIKGLLHQIIQKDTKSYIEIKDVEPGDTSVILEHFILDNGYTEVYGLLEDGRYHRYFDNSQKGENRYCRFEQIGKYQIKVDFDDVVPKKVIAVYRDMSVMAYRILGKLYGYDEQQVALSPIERVYRDGFCVLVVEKDVQGDEICHIVYPEDDTPGEVRYSVLENENMIVIHDCGKYEGAQIRLGMYCVYMGDRASVLPNTEFVIPGSTLTFRNIAAGKNGYYSDSFETLRRRFADDIKTPATMVTGSDCERIVGSVPGLSIHKTGVSANTKKNEIYVVVKPNSSERFPKLSDTYIDVMKKYFEKYRMLSSKIIIRQPVYVAINVSGMLYTKKYLNNSYQNIENTLSKMLDGINSDARFGAKVVFHEIYEKISSMDCVDNIAELSIVPESYTYAKKSGLDIQLDSNALFYPGKISLEILEI
jgi:hypothetical protein